MNKASINSVAAIQEDFNAKVEMVEFLLCTDIFDIPFFYGVIKISTNRVV